MLHITKRLDQTYQQCLNQLLRQWHQLIRMPHKQSLNQFFLFQNQSIQMRRLTTGLLRVRRLMRKSRSSWSCTAIIHGSALDTQKHG